jgi:hypothetical protein
VRNGYQKGKAQGGLESKHAVVLIDKTITMPSRNGPDRVAMSDVASHLFPRWTTIPSKDKELHSHLHRFIMPTCEYTYAFIATGIRDLLAGIQSKSSKRRQRKRKMPPSRPTKTLGIDIPVCLWREPNLIPLNLLLDFHHAPLPQIVLAPS